MIIYHPIYDIDHGRFRLLHLLSCASSHRLHWDAYRIIDLIYLFPSLMKDIDTTRGLVTLKRKISARDAKYDQLPNPRVFIEQIVGIHEIIITSLLSQKLISEELYNNNIIGLGDEEIPIALQDLISASPDHEFVSKMCGELSQIPINGPNGLKSRTRFLEHRYDIA